MSQERTEALEDEVLIASWDLSYLRRARRDGWVAMAAALLKGSNFLRSLEANDTAFKWEADEVRAWLAQAIPYENEHGFGSLLNISDPAVKAEVETLNPIWASLGKATVRLESR